MKGNEPFEEELPFTKVPNILLDHWVNRLSLVEIRIVAAILRRTFGWHRKDSGPLSVTELIRITERSRPLVVRALARLKRFGIVTSSRLSRQESFVYRLIMQPEFTPLKEAPPPVRQRAALPYEVHHFSSKENLTTDTRSVVKEPLPLSSKENLTTEPPVLRSNKERGSKERHTPRARDVAPVENIAAKQRVYGSRFTRKQVLEYAQASRDYTQCVNSYWEMRGQKQNFTTGIKNPIAFTSKALRTGQFDDDIQEWLNDPSMFDVERFLANRTSNY